MFNQFLTEEFAVKVAAAIALHLLFFAAKYAWRRWRPQLLQFEPWGPGLLCSGFGACIVSFCVIGGFAHAFATEPVVPMAMWQIQAAGGLLAFAAGWRMLPI